MFGEGPTSLLRPLPGKARAGRARSFVPSAHVLGDFQQEQLFEQPPAAVEEPPETIHPLESEQESAAG
jgi:hypothetical protein